MYPARIRNTYELRGTVQGVGFRPAILRLAAAAGLSGSVQNRTDSVRLVLEGDPAAIEDFIAELPARLPRNAKVDFLEKHSTTEVLPSDATENFSILPSDPAGTIALTIPADLAICPDCRADLTTPGNRRYGYAFTTCANCGPRYTVIHTTPYDRTRTTMSAFPMCADCRREYEDPADRRFHAETTACPACGPALSLENPAGSLQPSPEPLRRVRQELRAGRIVAVRGIGGFLLAADAFNRATLEELRRRKQRPHKPFAIMAPDLPTVARYCSLTPEAEPLLSSAEAPIVILNLRLDTCAAAGLPIDLISPDTQTVGIMLPTSPLHELLFKPLAGDPTPPFELLIMTSGNRGGEPICITNPEARERLAGICDLLLTHNREINLRNDDSICVLRDGRPQVWRRARGFAPNPVQLPTPLHGNILAMGADMKNSITFAHGSIAVMSPHIGDLETPESLDSIETLAECLPRFLAREPAAIAVDLHPDMHSTQLGEKIAAARRIPAFRVQHHHAHAAACLAEHGLDQALALVFDGTGLGTDGTFWGAELLLANRTEFTRLASFEPAPLPGGDAAIRNPARQLVARFLACDCSLNSHWKSRLGISDTEVELWTRQCRESINTPITHAAGRLFDAIAALLGLAPARTTYEGQAAIRLESAALRCLNHSSIPTLPTDMHERNGKLFIDWNRTFAMLHETGVVDGKVDVFAMAVHQAAARAAVDMVHFGLSRSSVRTVALSGGVFMNRILHELVSRQLTESGLEVVVHRTVPPNDGGISLGQAVIAGNSLTALK